MSGALLFFHRDAGPVAHILVGTGKGVEEGGLAAVGIARQGNAHGAVVVGGGVIPGAVGLQLVDVVAHLPAGHFRIGDVAGHGVAGGAGGALGLAHGDLGGVRLAQGQLIAPQADLQRVPQRGHLGDSDLGAGGQAHIHQPPLHSARLVAHRQDHTALAGGELLKGAWDVFLIFHILGPLCLQQKHNCFDHIFYPRKGHFSREAGHFLANQRNRKRENCAQLPTGN